MTGQELDIQKMFTRLEGKISKIESSTERTEKALFGNGQPGLVERVAKLETDDHSLQNTINGKPSLVERVAKLETKVGIVASIAGVIASVIATIGSEIIKHFL